MTQNDAAANVTSLLEARVTPEVQKILDQWEKLNDDFVFEPVSTKNRYLVDGLFVMGKVNVLAGMGAIRKTQMLIELKGSVAYPRPGYEESWLGAKVMVHGSVIYISAEEDRDDFHERMVDLSFAERRMAYYNGEKGKSRVTPIDKTESGPLFVVERGSVVPTARYWALRVRASRERPAMIVIDTTNALCPVDIDKSTDNGQAVSHWLGVMATESGAAVILVHHIIKTGEIANRTQARAAVKGTTAIVDGPRNVLVFWEAPERKGELAVRAGIVSDPAEVFMAAVVKANGKGADKRERYVTPTGQGAVLSDITSRMAQAELDHKDSMPAPRKPGRPKKGA